MDRNISAYNPETHTLFIRAGARVEEIAAVLEFVPRNEVMKLQEALLMVVAIRSLEKALGDGGDR